MEKKIERERGDRKRETGDRNREKKKGRQRKRDKEGERENIRVVSMFLVLGI